MTTQQVGTRDRMGTQVSRLSSEYSPVTLLLPEECGPHSAVFSLLSNVEGQATRSPDFHSDVLSSVIGCASTKGRILSFFVLTLVDNTAAQSMIGSFEREHTGQTCVRIRIATESCVVLDKMLLSLSLAFLLHKLKNVTIFLWGVEMFGAHGRCMAGVWNKPAEEVFEVDDMGLQITNSEPRDARL